MRNVNARTAEVSLLRLSPTLHHARGPDRRGHLTTLTDVPSDG